jgi:hypothetical protein
MLDSDCFGEAGALGFLTQADVHLIHEVMDRQRKAGALGPSLDVIIPSIARRQIASGPNEAIRLANQFIFTDTTPLNDNPDEAIRRGAIRSVFRGNASSDKHDPDADVLFETEKYGCNVLVSKDVRARKKARSVGVGAMSPAEFMIALRLDQWPYE